MRFHVSSLPCILAAFIASGLLPRCLAAPRLVSSHIGLDTESQEDRQRIDGASLIQASLRHTRVQDASEAGDASAATSLQSGGVVGASAQSLLASLPVIDDSLSSSPAMFAYAMTQASSKVMLVATSAHSYASFSSYIRQHWVFLFFTFLLFLCGLLVIWFNEIRQVKMDALLIRGLNECESIDANKVNEDTQGCLVHVVGQTFGATPVQDPQFDGANVPNSLKLQSTVEAYEWVQTVRIGPQPGRQTSDNKKIGYHFQKEWSTVHRNSLQFQRIAGKASPDNPRPPRGLNLGTFTSVCKNIKLGGFTLPEDMSEQFRSFEVVPIRLMPPTLQACGVVFYANKDGYFYSRPSNKSMWGKTTLGPSSEPVVGDLRVRFLHVPQGVATVVAVHCSKSGVDTFVPYRAIPRGCCTNEDQDRQRLIEEGGRSLVDINAEDDEMVPCFETKRMAIACCFCPCTTIKACTKEVVTEEIYYVSEDRDPVEKPFEWVVPRSSMRVWFFRVVGWLLCFAAVVSVLNSLTLVRDVNSTTMGALKVYGSWAEGVMAALITTAAATFVIALACLFYSPGQSLKWICAMVVVIAVPFVTGWVQRA